MEQHAASDALSVHTELAALPLAGPTILRADATLRAVAAAMLDARTDAVLLSTQPLSIVTERDLVRAFARGSGGSDQARTIATRDVRTIEEHASVLGAAQTMDAHAVGHLVVVDHHGGVTGVISTRAVAAVLARSTDQPTWVSALRVALQISA